MDKCPIKIVDFGGGYGFLGTKLLPLLPERSSYTGIDIGTELIRKGKQLFENSLYAVEFIDSNLPDYEPKQEFDLAICQAVFRYIPQYKNILKK